jgi:glucokinase
MKSPKKNNKSTPPQKKSFTIGLDLGGTKLAGALLDQNGSILEFTKIPVELNKEKNPKKTQARIIEYMNDICHDYKKRFPTEVNQKFFKGIGLASAGPLDTSKGLLINPVNFPGWKKVKIQSLLSDSLKKTNFKTSVYFQNDAIAAALAEGWIGAAQGMKTFGIITVGTGIGSGMIFNGTPCHFQGMGSEFGHLIADMNSLMKSPRQIKNYTIEGIASGTALVRRAKNLGFQGESVEELIFAYKSGEDKYKVLFDEMAFALSILCYNLSIGFHPQGLFVSGGLLKIKDLFFDQMKSNYNNLITEFNPNFKTKIQIAKTKNQAGVIGAGYLPYIYS